MREKAKLYFKRETYLEDFIDNNIFSLPYSHRIEDIQKKNKKKKIDLLVSFGQHLTGLRGEVQKISEKLKGEFQVFNKFTNQENFYNNILDSYLVADAWGAGNCRVRSQMVQINSVTLIQQKWNIINPFPFIDGVNIIEYSNINEFLEKVSYYLNNKKKLLEIGKKGYQHSLKHHTSDKRLNYIFDIINNKINLYELLK